MTFGEKLKKLRNDNGLTQEQLADKIFVTRTAVSKWETNNGFPNLDSLKQLSNLFGVSIDELMSDEDIENRKLLEEKAAKKFYLFAVSLFGIALIFTLLAYFLKLPYLNIISSIAVLSFLFFALLSKPKYKRVESRKKTATFVISRIIIFVIVLGALASTLIQIFI